MNLLMNEIPVWKGKIKTIRLMRDFQKKSDIAWSGESASFGTAELSKTPSGSMRDE